MNIMNNQDYKTYWMQNVNRMPRNRLPILMKKTAPQKAEGTKEDHWRDFWMCVRPNGSSGPTPWLLHHDDDDDDE
jgi:hypothetical protein